MFSRAILAMLCMLALSACGTAETAGTASTGGTIQVSDPWARPNAAPVMSDSMAMPTGEAMSGMTMDMSGASSAAYLTISNSGDAADRLVKVSSDVAAAVELHNNENKDGVMIMTQLQSVDVPAGGTVEFDPGGMHMMLIGLKRDLKAGESVPITLQFAQAGDVAVQATVRDE